MKHTANAYNEYWIRLEAFRTKSYDSNIDTLNPKLLYETEPAIPGDTRPNGQALRSSDSLSTLNENSHVEAKDLRLGRWRLYMIVFLEKLMGDFHLRFQSSSP